MNYLNRWYQYLLILPIAGSICRVASADVRSKHDTGAVELAVMIVDGKPKASIFKSNGSLLTEADLSSSDQVLAKRQFRSPGIHDVKPKLRLFPDQIHGPAAEEIIEGIELPESDDQLTKCPKTESLLDGPCTITSSNGATIVDLRFHGGILEGPYSRTEVSVTGAQVVIEEGAFTNGRLNGLVRRWDRGGSLGFELHFTNGLLDGKQISFQGGRPSFESNFRDERLTGPYRRYTKKGALEFETHYDKGVEEGIRKEFTNDGKLRSVSEYSNGKLNGIQTLYFPNGAVKSKIPFKDGRENGEGQFLYRSGALLAKIQFVRGLKTGTLEFYDEQGRLWQQGEFEASGKLDGFLREYHYREDDFVTMHWEHAGKKKSK